LSWQNDHNGYGEATGENTRRQEWINVDGPSPKVEYRPRGSKEGIMSKRQIYYGEHLDQAQGLVVPPSTVVAFFAVWGTGCHGCTARVRNRLLDLKGVLTADVEQGIAAAFFDPGRVTVNDLKRAMMMPSDNDHRRYRAEVIDQMSVAEALCLLGTAAPQKGGRCLEGQGVALNDAVKSGSRGSS
jgi:hypothetical protein